jgi:hypothetical protein
MAALRLRGAMPRQPRSRKSDRTRVDSLKESQLAARRDLLLLVDRQRGRDTLLGETATELEHLRLRPKEVALDGAVRADDVL